MAMDGDSWGTSVASAIQAIGVSAGTPVTPAQLEAVWKAIKGEDVTHLTNNVEVDSDGDTGTGSAGGPLPIADLPGTIT